MLEVQDGANPGDVLPQDQSAVFESTLGAQPVASSAAPDA